MIISIILIKKIVFLFCIFSAVIGINCVKAYPVDSQNEPLLDSSDPIESLISQKIGLLKNQSSAIKKFFSDNPNEYLLTSLVDGIDKIVKVDDSKKCYAIYQYPLGKGSYAKVQLAQDIETGEKAAVKIQPYKTEEEQADLLHEKQQLRKVKDYYGDFDDRKAQVFYLFSRFAKGTSVENLYLNAPFLNTRGVYDIILSSFYALKRIHDQDVVHNDVHEGNLVYDLCSKTALWVDLAFAITLEPQAEVKKIRLPKPEDIPCHKAPESNVERSFATDIYQLGFMSLRMLLVFSELDQNLKFRYIESRELCLEAIEQKYGTQRKNLFLEGNSNDKLSKEIIVLLFKMMDPDKTKRPTIGDAIFTLEGYLKQSGEYKAR